MAIVLIWNNHVYPVNNYPGHAAMSIDEKWLPGEQAVSYVSWWPGDQKKGLSKYTPDPMLSVSADLQEEGYAPDHILELDMVNAGLMQAKWNGIRNDPEKKYRFLRHNCSTVVGQVLREGSRRGSFGERNNLVWTPLKVLRLAKAMGGAEITWTEFLMRLRMAGYITATDSKVLHQLFKRDSKHGKNATQNSYYYSGGRKVEDKTFLQWQEYRAGKAGDGVTYFKSEGGAIFSSGHIEAINDQRGEFKEHFTGQF